ncbi:hypothetical protein CKM354_000004600 [Cercospora kikuchii]|uniref:Uncharacterized protein n=1 Tax=Cercospora kikuchii TaxID=84275 RepID=A0A9P3C8B2_9PEZI|nr:uncharacterized protein CKM354_000004600 [Cercospora kikuchii]GIZ36576.1 hypothetical protein CKM354_000004600 [Cercospora kikuchii]
MRCFTSESDIIWHEVAPGEMVFFEFHAEVDTDETNSMSEWVLTCLDNHDLPGQVFLCNIEGVRLRCSPKAPWSSVHVSQSTLLQSYAEQDPESYALTVTRHHSQAIERALQAQLWIEYEPARSHPTRYYTPETEFDLSLQAFRFARAFRLRPVVDELMQILWRKASCFEHLLTLNQMHYTGELSTTPYENAKPEHEPEATIYMLQDLASSGLFVFLYDQYYKEAGSEFDPQAGEEAKDRLYFLVRSDAADSFYAKLLAALQKIDIITVQAMKIGRAGNNHLLTPDTEVIESFQRDQGPSGSLVQHQEFDAHEEDICRYENVVKMEPVVFSIVAKFWEPVDVLVLVLKTVKSLMA